MTSNQYNDDNREIVWLTVHYSPVTTGWFIETTYHGFITHAIAKQFFAIEGKTVVYMVRGFADYKDAQDFAVDYHEAKRDGNLSRLRLD